MAFNAIAVDDGHGVPSCIPAELPADPTLPGSAAAGKGWRLVSGKLWGSTGCGGKDGCKVRPRITAASEHRNYALAMGEDNTTDRGDGRTLLEKLQVIGQQGEVLAFMRNMRLEQQSKGPFEKASLVKEQYEREQAQILQWLGKTDDPQWWSGATEQDVFEVFGVSST